jgi:dextranase
MNLSSILVGLSFFSALVLLPCCTKVEEVSDNIEDKLPKSTLLRSISITTDKARYNPGDIVYFQADRAQKGLAIKYWHLGELLDIIPLSEDNWTWTLPNDDFKGYYVEVIGKNADGQIRTVGAVAVDASSDWTRFPRYGFLSKFGEMVTSGRIDAVLTNLKKYHINALQYYDWMYDHHHPLAGSVTKPDSDWPSIIGDINSLETIRSYIAKGHELNIASMWYDLCYGAMEWASEDGVSWEWAIYKDPSHNNRDYHPLSAPFLSNIYLMNPGNAQWLNYFSAQAQDVYKVFDFDGFHIDQLGYRGVRYDYSGAEVDVEKGFGAFISKMKQVSPDKKLAFNAVSLNGQKYIASAPSDFLYVELWDTRFSALAKVFSENRSLAPEKNTVIAGYVNYKQSGFFNTPAVLLTDAVIFAMGGAHIELGEHMLGNEYFPDASLEMDETLKNSLVSYYDFLTGYENILRDNVEPVNLTVSSDKVSISGFGPIKGSVNVLTRKVDGKIVVHLLNFKDAVHLDWRDDSRTQKEPNEIKEFDISVRTAKDVNKVWIASPDIDGGVPKQASFKSSGIKVSIMVPSLKYWTMIVIE